MHVEIYTDAPHGEEKGLRPYQEMYEKYLLRYDEITGRKVERSFDLKFFPEVGSMFGRSTNHYLLAVEAGAIAGVLKLRVDGKPSIDGHKRWMSYVSVSPSVQNQGVATLLIQRMFQHCRENKLSKIYQSRYTDEGFKHIMKVFDRFSAQYPDVDFIDDHRQ